MKRTVGIIITISVLIQALFLYSCAGKKEKFSAYSFDYFDTVTTVVGYAESKEEFDKIYNEITETLSEYHKLYDIYNSYDGVNNLYTINNTSGAVNVDQKIIDLLICAKELYNTTNGAFNVAMGSVLFIWHDYREKASLSPDKAALPSEEELRNASEHTDIDNIIIDTNANTVLRADSSLKIDVGGLAKGYAVEMTAKMLEDKGVDGYLLNVGGNVRAIGKKGDGKPWKVGIENPNTESSEPYVAELEITDGSLVTSGSYQRYYEYNGKRYHHIIDTETLMPSEYYLSVSVLTSDSGLADALSTALFVMPYEEGLALVESLDGVEAMWVKTDGTKAFSSGFKTK
jgi:thiamine biosynthesis lipoprotein